jgi:hypothetical protein
MSQANQTSDQWYCVVNSQQHGPVPWTELQKLATEGKLARSDRIWRQGFAEWVLAEEVKGLFATVEEHSSLVCMMNKLLARFKKTAVSAKPDSAAFKKFAKNTSRQVKSKTTWL